MFRVDEAPWSDGVYIVSSTPSCYSRCKVAKVCDLPDQPYDFASIMCSQDDLCTWMGKYEQTYMKKYNHGPSRFELCTEILLFLAEKAGHRKKKQKKQPSRQIDLIL